MTLLLFLYELGELLNESELALHSLLYIQFHKMQNNGVLMRAIAASHS